MNYKRKIFLCRSYYHLMIAISKTIDDPQKSLIYYVKEEFNEEDINKIAINCSFYQLGIVGVSEKDKNYEMDFKNYNTLHMFHWAVHKYPERRFFKEFKNKNIILVEDGATHHEVFRSQKYSKIRIMKNIVNFITTGKIYIENSKRIKEILVTFPEKYPATIQKKMSRLTFQTLSKDEINMYMKIFDIKYPIHTNLNKKKAIVFTQPLSEDGFISEKTKKNLYLNIFKNLFSEGYEIYLKQHPREISNYNDDISSYDIINLPKNFPGELINFMNFEIDQAISICSGVVYNINAKSRIQLNENFFIDYKK